MDVEEEQLEAEYSTLAQVESDILAANPLTVKERIDEALVELGDLRNSSRSRADIISSLARYACVCASCSLLPIH